jgi:hypothetical protein
MIIIYMKKRRVKKYRKTKNMKGKRRVKSKKMVKALEDMFKSLNI